MSLLPYGENMDVLRRHAEDESIDSSSSAAVRQQRQRQRPFRRARTDEGSRASQGTDSIRVRSPG
jgi:hypothetical protein